MSYYAKTQQLLKIYDVEGKNILRHFFAELTQIRHLYSFALMNAISYVQDASTVSDLICNSVTVEPWMKDIVRKDIRNVVCFNVLKEFNEVIGTQPYVRKGIVVNDTPSVIGSHIKELGILMETCYYIRHIFIIVNNRDIIDESWKMYHDFIHENTLIDSCHIIYELLKDLINY